jgi:hypothetical protein
VILLRRILVIKGERQFRLRLNALGSRVKIYPDSAHGFLFQHHAQFAAGVDAFLAGT